MKKCSNRLLLRLSDIKNTYNDSEQEDDILDEDLPQYWFPCKEVRSHSVHSIKRRVHCLRSYNSVKIAAVVLPVKVKALKYAKLTHYSSLYVKKNN